MRPLPLLFAALVGAACSSFSSDPAKEAPKDAGTDTGTPNIDSGGNPPPERPDADVSSAYQTLVLAADPIAFWRMEDSMTPIPNSVGGPALALMVSAGATFGQKGIAGSRAIQIGTGTFSTSIGAPFTMKKPFAIELWLARSAVVSPDAGLGTSGTTLFRWGDSNQTAAETVDVVFVGESVQFSRRTTTNGDMPISVAAPAKDGEFHYYLAMFTGSEVVLQVDGTMANAASSLSFDDDARAFDIAPVIANAHTTGIVDEVAIYDHVLDANQIAAHRAAGHP